MTEKIELADIGTGESLGFLNITDYTKCVVCGGIDFNIYKMEARYYAICNKCHSRFLDTGNIVTGGKPKWQYGLEKYEKCRNESVFDF